MLTSNQQRIHELRTELFDIDVRVDRLKARRREVAEELSELSGRIVPDASDPLHHVLMVTTEEAVVSILPETQRDDS